MPVHYCAECLGIRAVSCEEAFIINPRHLQVFHQHAASIGRLVGVLFLHLHHARESVACMCVCICEVLLFESSSLLSKKTESIPSETTDTMPWWLGAKQLKRGGQELDHQNLRPLTLLWQAVAPHAPKSSDSSQR